MTANLMQAFVHQHVDLLLEYLIKDVLVKPLHHNTSCRFHCVSVTFSEEALPTAFEISAADAGQGTGAVW